MQLRAKDCLLMCSTLTRSLLQGEFEDGDDMELVEQLTHDVLKVPVPT